MITLPSFASITSKIARGIALNPLELFIHKHEPTYVADEALFLKEFGAALDFAIRNTDSPPVSEECPAVLELSEDEDSLLKAAKDIILQEGRVSASLLQRRLRLGYVQAVRILDLLTASGFLGLKPGTNERVVLQVSVGTRS
jgi:DNA segregation ATPase FtsK/SpoIIIE-like protein